MKHQQRFKKASKALRTFNSEISKSYHFDYKGDSNKKNRDRRHKAFMDMQKLLIETIGEEALYEMFWEGKEL